MTVAVNLLTPADAGGAGSARLHWRVSVL